MFDKFFPIFNQFNKDLKDVFSTIHFMNVPRCEGDDIIAVLCKETFKDQVTYGIFAPWACYKSELIEIGLHDELFHSYQEDSDIFNRMVLSGMKCIQSRDAFVYHLTCRGGQFQEGVEKVTTDSAFHIMKKNAARNYIRKWGSWVRNDEYQHPIIPPKYNIAFIVENCNLMLLEALEPFCDRIYVDEVFNIGRMWDYVEGEQCNTKYDLSKRVVTIQNNDPLNENDIIIKFNAQQLTQDNFQLLQQMPDIIKEAGDVTGEFAVDIFTVYINQIVEYQDDLIFISK
jgi:hypothetical protein